MNDRGPAVIKQRRSRVTCGRTVFRASPAEVKRVFRVSLVKWNAEDATIRAILTCVDNVNFQ